MKTLLKILAVLVLLAILLSVISLFLPSHVEVKRQVQINAPNRIVFNQVNDLHNWQAWSVWNQMDPNMHIEYQQSGIGEGAGYSWKSTKREVGTGSLKIIKAAPYDSIRIQLNFGEFDTAYSSFFFTQVADQTMVDWIFHSELGMNPLKRWFGLLLMDKMLGPDLQKSLESLKTVSEEYYKSKQPMVELLSLPETKYIGIREPVRSNEMSAIMARNYGALYNKVEKDGLTMTDLPFAIYSKVKGDSVDLVCGIPVLQAETTDPRIIYDTLPARYYAEADHFGSYQSLEKTHAVIEKWLKIHNIKQTGSPMEKYLTDAYEIKDSTEWITAVFYPVDLNQGHN